ncbi:MAG: tetratricopeptide repeat protein [Ktedonobacteraceae bacterium]
MTSPQHRIFVSHSHLDNEFGTRLTQDLRRVLGDESAVFYDVLGGLHGGETWWEKIVEELSTRDVFILVLSPNAMNSKWVRLEINVALNEDKYIIPLLYRPCSIRADLKTIQIISFLAPQRYEAAFQEVLGALGLPPEMPVAHKVGASQTASSATTWLRQIEAAFAAQDWSDVIRKADYLIKHLPDSATTTVYRLQGLAYLEEGEEQHALEALETALVLVSDRQQRLTLLSDYTALLARQNQWAKVLKRAKEALRLVPNDPGWLATQQQAQNELAKQAPVPSVSREQTPTRGQKLAPTPQKTKEQWLEEGYALWNLKRYEEALAAFEQALRLDPNLASAYYNKGKALLDLNRPEEALAAFEQALRLDPNLTSAYHGKGAALWELKRPEEALAAFEQALRLDPNDALAYYNKGNTLERLGRNREAQRARERARQLGYYG